MLNNFSYSGDGLFGDNNMKFYGHYEFENLMKEEENKECFDCGKRPAQWASINNGIYLCLNCAGVHRGYGVLISYVRSITIDTWNENQMSMMKNGGNKSLMQLLDVYSIDRLKINKETLYNSRLLEFYRKLIKSKINGEGITKNPPTKEEALKSFKIDNQGGFSSYDNTKLPLSASKPKEENKFASISSTPEPGESVEEAPTDKGFSSALNSWMSKAIDSTKFIAGKVGELELGSSILNTTSAVAEKGSNLVDKATEAAKSEKVESFAKKANDGINYFMNKLFGSAKKQQNEGSENTQQG